VAGAGLNRLGLSAPGRIPLTPPDFLPAAGQAALGHEYRADDAATAGLVAFLDHPDTRDPAFAARRLLCVRDGGGRVAGARIAVGAVAPTVGRCQEAQARLLGRRLDREALAEAGGAVRRAVSPIDDIRATAAYRRKVAGNLLLRMAGR